MTSAQSSSHTTTGVPPASATTAAAAPSPPQSIVDGHSTRVDSYNTRAGKVLCVSDIRGSISTLNTLAAEHNAVAIIHSGDFGFYEPSSLTSISERTLRHLIQYSTLISPAFRSQLLAPNVTSNEMRNMLRNPPKEFGPHFGLSEFPRLLSGEIQLRVPVYTVWGACEDVAILEKIRLAAPSALSVPTEPRQESESGGPDGRSTPGYSIRNLTVLDEATTRVLDIGGIRLRLFGLGGAVVPHKFFDNGTGTATIAGGAGTMWTTMLQIGELVDTAQKVYDASETRLLVSHAAPGREGLLAQLALVLKADLSVSAGLHFRYGVSYNEFAVHHDAEAYRLKLEAAKKAFVEVWDTVKAQVDSVIDENQQLLLANALAVATRVPAPPPTNGAQANEESAWKNCWNWNLPDAAFGSLILDIRDGRVGSEMKSQGFNFAYRTGTTRPPAGAPGTAGALGGPQSTAKPAPSGSALAKGAPVAQSIPAASSTSQPQQPTPTRPGPGGFSGGGPGALSRQSSGSGTLRNVAAQNHVRAPSGPPGGAAGGSGWAGKSASPAPSPAPSALATAATSSSTNDVGPGKPSRQQQQSGQPQGQGSKGGRRDDGPASGSAQGRQNTARTGQAPPGQQQQQYQATSTPGPASRSNQAAAQPQPTPASTPAQQTNDRPVPEPTPGQNEAGWADDGSWGAAVAAAPTPGGPASSAEGWGNDDSWAAGPGAGAAAAATAATAEAAQAAVTPVPEPGSTTAAGDNVPGKTDDGWNAGWDSSPAPAPGPNGNAPAQGPRGPGAGNRRGGGGPGSRHASGTPRAPQQQQQQAGKESGAASDATTTATNGASWDSSAAASAGAGWDSSSATEGPSGARGGGRGVPRRGGRGGGRGGAGGPGGDTPRGGGGPGRGGRGPPRGGAAAAAATPGSAPAPAAGPGAAASADTSAASASANGGAGGSDRKAGSMGGGW